MKNKMKIQNIPPLRFKHFDDEWESTKLGKVGKTQSGVGFSDSEQGGNSGIPFYKVSDMNNSGNEYQMSNANNYVTDEQVNRRKWKVIDQLPAVIFAKVGAAIMLDRKRLVNSPFLIDNNTMAYIFGKHWNAQFGKTLFDTLKLSNFAQTGALPSFNGSDIEAIKVSIPPLPEQSAIGSLFQTLDELLSAYKDNLANYQAFKASMLSKMFPKAGQTTPEIRLDGFDGEWEEKKLGEVTERVQGNDGRMDLPTLTISAANGWMNQEDRFSQNIAGKEQKNYTLLKKGELSYNHGNSKLAKYGVVFELGSYEEALVPRVYHSFRVKDGLSDAKFLETMFTTKRPDRELGKLISSGARMDGLLNINYDEFMGIKITIPKIDEQKAIGGFFSNLGNLISFYQEKIEELETLKKKLLQDMFV
ncbi:HsdS specificity protein of type I restriction-modification system [Streptococcus criceti]|nr:restriction endonuclease subunit S [Streptococcus criceti]SUN43134.1 HsdS specificity protein of type I restriction-modification system [Streptococcus criceti]